MTTPFFHGLGVVFDSMGVGWWIGRENLGGVCGWANMIKLYSMKKREAFNKRRRRKANRRRRNQNAHLDRVCISVHYTTQSTNVQLLLGCYTVHWPSLRCYAVESILLVLLSRKLAHIPLHSDPFPTMSFILSATAHESLKKQVQRSCSPCGSGEHSRISGKEDQSLTPKF